MGVDSLNDAIFGKRKTSTEPCRAYSLRLPIDLACHVEVIVAESRLTKNQVLSDLISSGIDAFIDTLEPEQEASYTCAVVQAEQSLAPDSLEDF